MADVTITFPDGNKKNYPKGTTAYKIAESISEGLAKETVVASVDGTLVDADRPIEQDAKLELIKFKDPRGQEVFWHSSAHVLAQAVKRLYPDAKPTIGPPLSEGGFYYDFANLDIKEEELGRIEEEMMKVAKENHATERIEYGTQEEAKQAFENNEFKQEIIEESDENLSAYTQGEFIDLCRGPHMPRTGMIKGAWLHKLSGAYWRADAKNQQLTRIYGITFPDKKQLKKYQQRMEEAAKRDHRKLGKRLDLFGFEEVSPGAPFFYPNGTVIYNALLAFIREEYRRRGYDEVITPLIYDKALWERSGHWEHYKDDMYMMQTKHHTFSPKPMNCPSHCLIYNRTQYSYRDLPVRIADFASLHRNELSGTLTGLTRVTKFSQDDAHIFCTLEQVQSEIAACIDFCNHIYQDVFGMEYDHVELSTRPEKFLGDAKDWDKAEEALQAALESQNVDYVINEGDGAFYGPKIDFHIKDAIGRTWQTATIQLDFQLPGRFECEYVGEDNSKHQAVMIHRALLGSVERFMAVLIEHYAGKMPLWLAPQQVRILPITDRHTEYAGEVLFALQEAGVRAAVDERSESVSKKVREAQLDYVPYILVVGDNEQEAGTVTVRTRDGNVEDPSKTEDFIERVTSEITDRS